MKAEVRRVLNFVDFYVSFSYDLITIFGCFPIYAMIFSSDSNALK